MLLEMGTEIAPEEIKRLSQSKTMPSCEMCLVMRVKFSAVRTISHRNLKCSVHFSSVAQSCLTLCDPINCIMPGLSVHHQLLEFTQTHVHQVSDVIRPSHPLSSPSPLAPNPSQQQGLFQWVNSSHEVAKVLEFQPQHQSFQRTPRTGSFRMDWLDLLAVQGTLKSLLQHHSSKASILWCSAFFIVQLSYDHWKNHSFDSLWWMISDLWSLKKI